MTTSASYLKDVELGAQGLQTPTNTNAWEARKRIPGVFVNGVERAA
jgi:hypothetical protein